MNKLKWNLICATLLSFGLCVFVSAILAAGQEGEGLSAKIDRLAEQLEKDPLNTNIVFELYQSRQEYSQQEAKMLDMLLVGLRAYHDGNDRAAVKWLKESRQSPMAVELADRYITEPLGDIIANAQAAADASLCNSCGNTGGVDCQKCKGLAMVRCSRCKGSGEARSRTKSSLYVTCDLCNGWGRVECVECGGEGELLCSCSQGQKQAARNSLNDKTGSELDSLAGAISYLRAGGIDLYTQDGLDKAPD